ncbi:MAG: hypothetical protein U0359_33615 [Byssovorax sp.]
MACQAQHDLGCVISTFDCIVTCQAVQASNHACAAELQTYYACYADHVGELSACTMPDACVPAFGNILFCAENYCSTAACDHQESICTCPGICNNHAVISVCDGAECTCFVNGAVAGKCTDFSVPICGLKESCCTVLYFLD